MVEHSGDLKELIEGLTQADLLDIDGVRGDESAEPEEAETQDSEDDGEAGSDESPDAEASEAEDDGGDLGESEETEDGEGDGDEELEAEGSEDGEGEEADGEEAGSEQSWTLKAYGKTKEISSEEELLKYANLGLASDVKNRKANERLAEANQKTENSRKILTAITQSPIQSVLELFADKLGSMEKALDLFDQHLDAYLKPRYEAVAAKNEQAYRQGQELSWRERRLADKEERDKSEAEERRQEAYWGKLTRDTNKALDDAGLPRTKLIYGKVAQIMQETIELGFDPDPVEAVEEVARNLKPEERETPEDKAKAKDEKKTKIDKVKRNRTKRKANSQGGRKKPNREERRGSPQTTSEFFSGLYQQMNE